MLKREKNDYEIGHTSKRKKYNLAESCESSQIEKSQVHMIAHK